MLKVHLVKGEDDCDLLTRILDEINEVEDRDDFDLTEECLDIHTTVWTTEAEKKAYIDGVISSELDYYSFLTDDEANKINEMQEG